MSTFVYYQAYVFLATFYGGIIIGFIYDLYKIYRSLLKPRKIIAVLQDLFFWCVVTIIALAVLLYSNNGELRWYIFMGFVLGAVMYNILLSRVVVKSIKKFLNLVKKFYMYVYNKARRVFICIFKPIKYIFYMLYRFLSPYFRKVKRIFTIPKRMYMEAKKYTTTIFNKK
jgi:spore cortex biosynthesis protein YabQ